MNQKRLKIQSKTSFVKALESISKITDTVILSVKGDSHQISSITASADNTMIIYCEINNIETDYIGRLNIPDIKKLIRALDNIPTTEISLTINNNNIEYSDSSFKFKYHMYEDGFLTQPTIKIEKILGFEQDIRFNLKKEVLQSLIRGSTFATDTNKLYLYTENSRLKGELTDRSKHNTDVFELDLGEVEFDLCPLPLNLDNIKQLSILTDDISFGVNTKYGVSIIDIQNTDIKLKYILTSLTQ